MNQPYLLLLQDSILSKIIFYPAVGYVLDVMLMNHFYNLYHIYIIAVVAAMFAALINYSIGLLVRNFILPRLFLPYMDVINKGGDVFSKYAYWLLLLAYFDIWGALVVFAAGIYRFNIKKFILLSFLSILVGYAFTVFV